MPDENAVLTPAQLKSRRREIVGWTLHQLSATTGIPSPRLCEYELGSGNLREDQLLSCQKALRKAMVDRGKQIALLLASEKVDGREMAG
jgi:hypothetical protein